MAHKPFEAEIEVLETMQIVLRGLRLCNNTAVAQVAIRRERDLEQELLRLRDAMAKQTIIRLSPYREDDAPSHLAQAAEDPK